MTATEELRKLLDERGVEYMGRGPNFTYWSNWSVVAQLDGERLWLSHYVTPEQAIAATLGDDDYERKMDALLCRLTNGKFSKSRQYDLDFMESCVNEEFEKLYEDELADAALGSDERYDAGFANGVKATLQQLDGLIYKGADVDEIQAWVDRQWEEES